MDYAIFLDKILKNTEHTLESIAAILDLQSTDLLRNPNKPECIDKLNTLYHFLQEYGLREYQMTDD